VLNEIAKGVYVEDRFEGGNVGLIRTERGGLLIDTPMLPPEARQWQLQLMQMGVAHVYGIVNTDYHPEHFIGNAIFMPIRTFGNDLSAKPIAKYQTSTLEQVANAYRNRDPILAADILHTQIYPPEISVSDRVTLHLGDRHVDLLYLEGHTPASLGVYLPEERILFAGDNIVNNEHPTLYQANNLAWLKTLRDIKDMDVDLLVPGVGEVCDKDVIDPTYGYIAEMWRRVLRLFLKGASRRECVDKVGMLDFFDYPEDQQSLIKRRRRESVERVYTEIRVSLRKKR